MWRPVTREHMIWAAFNVWGWRWRSNAQGDKVASGTRTYHGSSRPRTVPKPPPFSFPLVRSEFWSLATFRQHFEGVSLHWSRALSVRLTSLVGHLSRRSWDILIREGEGRRRRDWSFGPHQSLQEATVEVGLLHRFHICSLHAYGGGCSVFEPNNMLQTNYIAMFLVDPSECATGV